MKKGSIFTSSSATREPGRTTSMKCSEILLCQEKKKEWVINTCLSTANQTIACNTLYRYWLTKKYLTIPDNRQWTPLTNNSSLNAFEIILQQESYSHFLHRQSLGFRQCTSSKPLHTSAQLFHWCLHRLWSMVYKRSWTFGKICVVRWEIWIHEGLPTHFISYQEALGPGRTPLNSVQTWSCWRPNLFQTNFLIEIIIGNEMQELLETTGLECLTLFSFFFVCLLFRFCCVRLNIKMSRRLAGKSQLPYNRETEQRT